MIEAELKAKKKHDINSYKTELDRQLGIKQGMRAYGNMSAVEKQLNKADLQAYKNYENSNKALIPGIQNQAPVGMRASGEGVPGTTNGSPKPRKDIEEKVRENTQKFQKYGATHLGQEIS